MRFVFDTSVLIDYLHEDRPGDQELAAHSFSIASRLGVAFVSRISLMELYLPVQEEEGEAAGEHNSVANGNSPRSKGKTKSKAEIEQELARINKLFKEYRIKSVFCSTRSQEIALELLEYHRSPLGKSALTDSLIIASGLTRKAYLVTNDRKWFYIAKDRERRGLSALKVISPTDLVQERFKQSRDSQSESTRRDI